MLVLTGFLLELGVVRVREEPYLEQQKETMWALVMHSGVLVPVLLSELTLAAALRRRTGHRLWNTTSVKTIVDLLLYTD